MKKILGLDLGVGSVGWSAIEIDDDNNVHKLLGMGSRIVPLTVDETTGFTKGNGESVCHARTMKRSMRRNLDRFQQRRKRIGIVLGNLGLTFADDLLKLSPMELWNLRASAAGGQKLALSEIGRVIFHINSRRGYRSSKEDAAGDKKQSDYLAAIGARAKEASDRGQTPGQYFAERLKQSETITHGGKVYTYRIKEKVFPRKAYENELHTILKAQQTYYPDVLTDENIAEIEEAVFYQRPLKSCKHLVSLCEFESREIIDPDGKKHLVGPRVAPVSSPLFQVERLWEAVNNIVLVNSRNRRRKNADLTLSLFGDARKEAYEYRLTHDERLRVFEFLNTHAQMKGSDLLKILGLKKDDGFAVPANIARGMKGNATRAAIEKALAGMRGTEDLLRFDLRFEESGSVDEETGEVLKRVSSAYLREPLYRLWHTLYSISDRDELGKVLADKFGITDADVADNLFRLNFREAGYGNKSAKFMCKLIPYMRDEGLCYADACERVGTRHSESLTKEENDSRELLALIPQLKKGELRQPVVEKILNQTISLVNAAIGEFGSFDEIHVELARELKRSADERSSDYERNNKREKENKSCIEAIVGWGLRPSANRVRKYRMWKESEQVCMYCGQSVGVKEFLLGIDAEKEHVIPRSIFFDDSFSNKVCACRKCNDDKGQMTGYDFMAAQGEEKLQQYIDRVEKLHEMYKASKGERGISKTKHDRLLTSRENIPQDFIARDLRLTQYISRKALEILRQVCRDVFPTTGSVTDFFRHAWGYDEILHKLNLPRYSEAGQTDMVERNNRKEERIVGWNKRLDHRHHAIDALTIALTRHSHVQRLNTLNAGGVELGDLDKWAAAQPHFPVADVADAARCTAVSFRAGKRVSTPSRRYIRRGGKRVLVQDGLLTPRGAITEGYVNGKIRIRQKSCKLKVLFAAPDMICDERVRELVKHRLAEYAYDEKEAVKSCKKSPLKINGFNEAIEVADMWKEEFVMRYKVGEITYKNIKTIVDKAIRRIITDRFAEVGNSDKDFLKSLAERPLLSPGGAPIRNVRCFTGAAAEKVMPVLRSKDGKEVGYSKYGNNHHVALYIAPDDSLEESIVPFAVAVERRRLGLPVVVTNPEALWDTINSRRDELPDELLSRFPLPDRKFLISMQVNEMFIIGLSDDEINAAFNARRIELLTEHLYRVQKLAKRNYVFRRHTSTTAEISDEQKECKNYILIASAGKFKELNPVKVTVDRLGRIHRQI